LTASAGSKVSIESTSVDEKKSVEDAIRLLMQKGLIVRDLRSQKHVIKELNTGISKDPIQVIDLDAIERDLPQSHVTAD